MSSDPFAAVENAAARQVTEEQAAGALALARASLILGRDAKCAFFACLALRLKLEVDWSCGTMATDGRVLAYHPGFVAGLAPDELVGVLAHEVMHVALAHPFRRGTRDEAVWNIACDLAVNPLLLGVGVRLPAGRLMPGEGKYVELPAGKSAEEYYALLGPPPEPGTEGGSDPDPNPDAGGCGGVREPGDGSPAEVRDAESECLAAVAQAEQVAKGRGELPGGIGRSVDEVLRPVADWKSVLREFVRSDARDDYSWSRPNRRYIAQGLYLPGLHSDALGDVVLAVDTSGSVGPKELGVFAAEANAVLEAFDCTVTVIYHDTEVQKVTTWHSRDGPLSLDPVGGGRTGTKGGSDGNRVSRSVRQTTHAGSSPDAASQSNTQRCDVPPAGPDRQPDREHRGPRPGRRPGPRRVHPRPPADPVTLGGAIGLRERLGDRVKF